MVCSDKSLKDILETRYDSESSLKAKAILNEIDFRFIDRRKLAENMLFEKNYFDNIETVNLQEQIYSVNGQALEASKLDDLYRKMNDGISSPNYEQLIYILVGVKKRIIKEIKHRKIYE